jgi:hypothetical protein
MVDDPRKAHPLLVEVREVDASSGTTIELTSDRARRVLKELSDETLDLLKQSVGRACSVAAGALSSANRPDELTVKFGITLGAKAGNVVFLVTEANGEATFEIEAKWKNTPRAE